MIQSTGHAFADVPAEVEVRNEARVHIWYGQKFGSPIPPYTSTRTPSTPSPRLPAASESAWAQPGAGASSPPSPPARAAGPSRSSPGDQWVVQCEDAVDVERQYRALVSAYRSRTRRGLRARDAQIIFVVPGPFATMRCPGSIRAATAC